MPFNSIFTENGPRNFQVVSFCHCQSERAQIAAAWVYFYMAMMPHARMDAHVLLSRGRYELYAGGSSLDSPARRVLKQNNAAGTRLATRVFTKNGRSAEHQGKKSCFGP